MKTRGLTLASLFVIACILAILAPILMAGTITEPTVFRDRVMFRGSTGPDFDADNSFSIGGVKVTKTAAQLNSVVTNAVAATVITPQRAVNLSVTNLVVTTNLVYDSTGVACSNAAGAALYVITGITPQYEAVKAVTNATAATTLTLTP